MIQFFISLFSSLFSNVAWHFFPFLSTPPLPPKNPPPLAVGSQPPWPLHTDSQVLVLNCRTLLKWFSYCTDLSLYLGATASHRAATCRCLNVEHINMLRQPGGTMDPTSVLHWHCQNTALLDPLLHPSPKHHWAIRSFSTSVPLQPTIVLLRLSNGVLPRCATTLLGRLQFHSEWYHLCSINSQTPAVKHQ